MFAIYWFAIHLIVHLIYLAYIIGLSFIRPVSNGGNTFVIFISALSLGFGILLAFANYWMASEAPNHAGGDLLTLTYILAGIGGLVALAGVVHAFWMVLMAVVRLCRENAPPDRQEHI